MKQVKSLENPTIAGPTTTPNPQSVTQTPPQPVNNPANESYLPKEALVAQSIFDKEIGWLKRRLEDSNSLMHLIIIVLFIGFVTLLLAVLSILIQWWNFNAATQSELTKSLNNQNIILQNIGKDQEKFNNYLIQLTATQAPDKISGNKQ